LKTVFVRFSEASRLVEPACLCEAVARAGNDLNRAAAARAGFNINLKNPFESLRPAHHHLLLGRRAVLFPGRLPPRPRRAGVIRAR